MLRFAAALLLLLGAVPAHAQRVSWSPDRPVEGSIFRISVEGAEPGRLRGEAAGEPLHFAASAGGALEALAAVPIDTRAELEVALFTDGEAGVDTLRVRVPVRPGEYRMERLTVAPRFGREPDAALAARIADESARAMAVSRASHDTPRMWEGEFVRPRPGRVTSGFGHGRSFNGQVQSRHMGTDLAGAVGAPVRAANRARVALVGEFHLGGNVVYLDHGAGLVTAYLHLNRAHVREGEIVEAGQVIGEVGATGRVTGPHLHWIARYGTITIDPLSLPAATP
jgi:murein DD-endopeptidase MepM/ murein hydrolase activator NlpD